VDVAVRGQNLEVTQALASYLTEKLHKLDRYPGIATAQARMAVDGESHVVEVTVPVGDRLLRAEAKSADMYASIDQVSDRLLHQLKKYRERLTDHGHGERSGRPATGGPRLRNEAETLPREIVRVKRFPAKPMTVDEALLRLDLLGHDFFAFRDAESEEVCVIYRRRGGGYGLLVPQA
jgi:putative sigma-54 modulation protein